MASLLTHALLGAAVGKAATSGRDWEGSRRLWVAGMLCSMLPDIDVVGFGFGVRYGDLWGHRGMTHSLLFAAMIAAIVAVRLYEDLPHRWRAGLILFLLTASHGALDALTDGGLGVAFFSPFDPTRYFFPWRPIAVSPIGAGRFFSARGMHVLWTEVVWLWGPILIVAGSVWWVRRFIDNATEKQNLATD